MHRPWLFTAWQKLLHSSLLVLILLPLTILALPLETRQDMSKEAVFTTNLDAINATNSVEVIPSWFEIHPSWDQVGVEIPPKDIFITMTVALLTIAKVDPSAAIGPNPTVYQYGLARVEVRGAAAGLAPITAVLAAFGLYETLAAMHRNLRFTNGIFLLVANTQTVGSILVEKKRAPAIGGETVEPDISLPTVNSEVTFKDTNFLKTFSAHWGNKIEEYEFYLPLALMAVVITRVPMQHRVEPVSGIWLGNKNPSRWNFQVANIQAQPPIPLTPNDVVDVCLKALEEYLNMGDEAPTAELTLEALVSDPTLGFLARWELRLGSTPPDVENGQKIVTPTLRGTSQLGTGDDIFIAKE